MQRENGKRVAPKTPKEKKKSRLTRQQKLLLALVICLAVVLLIVIACQSFFVRPEVEDPKKNDQQDKTQQEEIDYGDGVRPRAEGERKSEDFYTVLILGRDTGGGGNTDTMMLASYDVTNQKATVMSIPRDTMVNVPWDVKKINSVYNMYGGGEDGIQAIYKEISQLVGFEPDYEVVVEWDAVGKIVDAMGGVYFDVPYTMDYDDPYQDLHIHQEEGYRLLNGDDAMEVIRWRQNDKFSPYKVEIGDDGRMKLQQDFIKAVIKQMMTPSNVLNIRKIAQVFQESVETDLSFQNILWFAQQAFTGGLSVEDVTFTTMPYKLTAAFSRLYSQEFGRAHYLSYVVPKSDELLEIVNTQLSPYMEEFTLADLDIMYVNRDGSVGSTTGYVEDGPSARAPDLSAYEERDEAAEGGDLIVDEEGNIIDPETGEVTISDPEGGEAPTDPEGGEETPDGGEGGGIIVVDPDAGETAPADPEDVGPDPDETDPGTADPGTTDPGTTDPGTTLPDETDPGVTDPAVTDPGITEPDTPAEPEFPDFAIIAPPPTE